MFLVECKYTDAKSYSITGKLLETVRREAAKQCKTGIIELELCGRIAYIVPQEVVEHYVELNTKQEK